MPCTAEVGTFFLKHKDTFRTKKRERHTQRESVWVCVCVCLSLCNIDNSDS